MGTPWTDDESRTAQDLFAIGHSHREIGEALGRSAGSVATQLSRLRSGVLQVSRTTPFWTPERNERLVELVIQGRSTRWIAIEFGFSESAIYGQAYRLGIYQKSLPTAVRDRVIELAGEGATIGRIARQTGVPDAGIRFILSRAGASLRTQSPSYRGPDARRAGR